MINEKLADRQGLSKQTRLEIALLHKGRADIFEASRKVESTEMQRELFSDWLDIERALQGLWGFEQDDNYIKFWEFPACSCPTMDNNDAYPYGYYSISGGGIIHGNEANKENEDERKRNE